MVFRSFGNLLRYCEPCNQRAVPLAFGLISVSNSKLNILKLSHDSDVEVAHNSIFSHGPGRSWNEQRPCSVYAASSDSVPHQGSEQSVHGSHCVRADALGQENTHPHPVPQRSLAGEACRSRRDYGHPRFLHICQEQNCCDYIASNQTKRSRIVIT